MRTYKIFLSVMFFALLISQSAFAQNTLELYNNTGNEIFVSYVQYDYEYKSWTSHGWYKVESYNSRTFDFGNYRGKVYLHGSYTGWLSNSYWGKGFTFCVEPNEAFDIRFSDKVNCSVKREFFETTISFGKNNFTFNP
jgi:uncharacterized membrane protein